LKERLAKVDQCLALNFKIVYICDSPNVLNQVSKDLFTYDTLSFIRFKTIDQNEIKKTIDVFFEHKQLFLDYKQQLTSALKNIFDDTRRPDSTISQNNFNRKKVMHVIKTFTEN